jgi:hypothetical protein
MGTSSRVRVACDPSGDTTSRTVSFGHFKGEVVSDLKGRPEGIRIKHRLNFNSIKMYDKQGSVLRVETTINDARDLKVCSTDISG